MEHLFKKLLVVTKSFYLITGQSFGTFLYSLSRPGGQDHVPHPSGRWEDFWKHVWARAEAQHHLAVLLWPGAAGTFSPSGPRQALPAHHAAHGHRRTDWCVLDRKSVWLLHYTKSHVFSIQVHSLRTSYSFDVVIFAYSVSKYACSGVSADFTGFLILFCAANLAQIAFESVVSVVNSLHNSQELAKDHQGRNCLLATYLYFVFRLPDTQHEIHTTGTVGLWYHLDHQWSKSKAIRFYVWNRLSF